MELTTEQALQQGVAAHKEGKLQEAERLYRIILQSQPLHPDANHNLGLIAVSVNKADAALPLFKTALEANPKIEQFWLSYIEALIKEKQFDNAKAALEQAKQQGVAEEKLNVLETKLTPTAQANEPKLAVQNKSLSFPQKRKKLSEQNKGKMKVTKQNLKANNPPQKQLNSLLEYYQNGRFNDAEKLAVFITNEFPKHQFAWKVLGVIFGQTGKNSEAAHANQTAVALSPQDAEAHNNLGNTLKELGRLDEAEASLRQAIALKPDYTEAHSNLGATLQELGRLDEAEASFTQAIALKPDLAEAHSNLGVTLKELGRLDEAEVSYTQAIALKPDYTEAHSNLGNTLQELGRLDEAEASFTQAIALKPDLAEAHSNLGVTLKELGRLDEAEVSYTQAIALKPDFAEAHYNLGNMLKELGRLNEAEASYKQAIALKPDDFANAYDGLGVILQSNGKHKDAEICYIKYQSLEPDKLSSIKSRGEILFYQGDFEQALRVFDSYDNITSRGHALECLYCLGRIESIYARIAAQPDLNSENIRVAAIAAFLTERTKKDTAHDFCNNPLDFIHVSNIASHIEDSNLFITEIIDELHNVKTDWELNTTRNGFQASTNVFKNPLEKMKILKSIIIDELDSYYTKFKNEPCSYITKWPSEKIVSGWHVILKQQGYQSAHIHPTGWLSGVIYLKNVPTMGKQEGAIKFSLDSPSYPDNCSSRKIHEPEVGDIVFFPSSLHHRTIPFTTDADRITVSFDLKPEAARC
jgi:uncharacterized protein (TIGR02466 family)